MAVFNPYALSQQLCGQLASRTLLEPHDRPAPDHLAQVLEAAYHASMERDEGRSLKFGLIWRSSSSADEPPYVVARFEKHRPFSSREIRQLAPATGSSSTFIAVDSDDTGPYIWGTLDVGSEWSQFRGAERSSGMALPFHIVITVSAPGTIRLQISDALVYSVEPGRPTRQSLNVLKFGPINEFCRPAIQQLLEEAFADWSDLIADPHFVASYGNEYLRFLTRTLRYTEELGHGGALIIVRESDEVAAKSFLKIKYPVSLSPWDELRQYVRLIFDEIEAAKLLTENSVPRELVDSWRMALRQRDKLGQRLTDRSRFLARLTQVDGALVLTQRLRVLGFGAVIANVDPKKPTFRSCQDELCRRFEESNRDNYGTRHRSAIGLCERMDCIVFVLSQDGGVKAVRGDGKQVLLWPAVSLDPSAWALTVEDINPELRDNYLNRSV